MKVAFRFTIAAVLAIAISACGKNESNNNGDSGTVIANLPTPSQQCLQQVSPQVWNPLVPFGFFGYGYAGYENQFGTYNGPAQNGYYQQSYYQQSRYRQYQQPVTTQYPAIHQNGFCGCGPGMIPVCDAQGMGCVQSNLLAGQPYAAWNFNQNTWNHSGWGNISFQNNNCANSVAQSCLVGQAYACGTSAICMPTRAGSPRGVCVRH